MTLEQINERLKLLMARNGRKYMLQAEAEREKVLAEAEKRSKDAKRRAYWAKRYAIRKSGYSPKRKQIF